MTPQQIVSNCCIEYGITEAQLTGVRRFKKWVAVRRIVAKELRKVGCSYPEIGGYLGGRDHTSIRWLLGCYSDAQIKKRYERSWRCHRRKQAIKRLTKKESSYNVSSSQTKGQ